MHMAVCADECGSIVFLILCFCNGGRRVMRTAGVRSLSRLTSLGIITLDDSVVVDVSECDFPALQQLTLQFIREERLQRLAPLFQSSITKLVLDGARRTPLSNLLKRLPELRALELVDVRGGRVVPLLTGRLRRLTELVMINTRLEDRHAPYFRRLHELRSLSLDLNEITAGFLRQLTGLTQLSRLSMMFCHALPPAAVLAFCSKIDAARAARGWPPLEVQSTRDSGTEGSDQRDARDATSAGGDPSFDEVMALHDDDDISNDDNEDDEFSDNDLISSDDEDDGFSSDDDNDDLPTDDDDNASSNGDDDDNF